jgi:DNA repair photolyase
MPPPFVSDKPRLVRALDVLKPFDPWSSPLCTCPPKLALDPYSGCGFECAYCYVSAYVPRYWGRDRVRPKVDLLRRLDRDLRRIADREDLACLRGLPVSLSNSSDPYPHFPQADEAALGLTRAALIAVADAGHPILIVTKSPLVVRDADILSRPRAVVAMAVTTLSDDLASRLEPNAPTPSARLAALADLARAGIPIAARIDPLLPGINDSPDDLAHLCDALAAAGVRQVIASTYKHRPDGFRRIAAAFPNAAAAIASLLDRTQRVSGYYYLRADVRTAMLSSVAALVRERGMAFSICREGLPGLTDVPCDGRAFLPGRE